MEKNKSIRFRALVRKGYLVFLSLLAVNAMAEELVIESFDGNGTLVFNQISNAVNYRVEWASSPSGPWTNSWEHLSTIQPDVVGSVTCKVAMCYRVVADVSVGNVISSNSLHGSTWDMGNSANELTSNPETLLFQADGTVQQVGYTYEYGGHGAWTGTYAVSDGIVSVSLERLHWHNTIGNRVDRLELRSNLKTSEAELEGSAIYTELDQSPITEDWFAKRCVAGQFENTVWDIPDISDNHQLKLYSNNRAEIVEPVEGDSSSYPLYFQEGGEKIYSGTYTISGNSFSAEVVVDWAIFQSGLSSETFTLDGSLVNPSTLSGTGNYVDTSDSDPANIDFNWTATKLSENP